MGDRGKRRGEKEEKLVEFVTWLELVHISIQFGFNLHKRILLIKSVFDYITKVEN